MEQILLTYGLFKEIITDILMLYKNMKAMIHFLIGDTDFLNIIVGVLQGDTIKPYLFILCLDYVLLTTIDPIKENSFTLKETRSRWYFTKTLS